MSGGRDGRDGFHSRSDDSQDSLSVGFFVLPDLQEIPLLDGSKGLSGSGITSEDNEFASFVKKMADTLPCVFIDDLKRSRTIGCSRIIPEVDIIILRQLLTDLFQDSQSAISTIKNSYFSHRFRKIWCKGTKK